MTKRIILGTIIFLLILFAANKLFFPSKSKEPEKSSTKKQTEKKAVGKKSKDNSEPETTKDLNINGEVVIDQIEDIRGLGYSGQRKIVQGLDGSFFVAYRKTYKSYSQIFVAKVKKESAGWKVSGTDKPIAVVESKTDQRVPSIAVGKDGVIHVVWYGSDSKEEKNNRQIKYSFSADQGVTWSQWTNIALVDGYDQEQEYWQEHPAIFVGNNNELYVVWEGKDSDHEKQQIKLTQSLDNGKTWEKWKNVQATKDNTQSRPTLISNSAGRLFLFMYSSFSNPNDQQQIQYCYSDDQGKSWSGWSSISDSQFDSRHFSLTIDQSGTIHVAWRSQTEKNGTPKIIYRQYKNNSWSEMQIVQPASDYQFFPSIGLDKNQTIYISWMQTSKPFEYPRENPEEGKLMISYRDVAGNFQFINLANQNNFSYYPNLAEMINSDVFPVVYEAKKDKENYQVKIQLIER